jgi:TonB family protein
MRVLAETALRSGVLVLAGLAAYAILRHRSAALRHSVLAASVLAAAAVVPLSLMLPPAIVVSVPSAWNSPPAAGDSIAPPRPADERAVVPVGSAPAPPVTGSNTARLLLVLWIAGIAVCAAPLLSGLGHLLRTTRRAERLVGGPWVAMAADVSAASGSTQPVALLQTTSPGVLATWGLFRPCVLLPAGAQSWSPQRIRIVLRHELAHVRRRDWCVQLIADLLRTAYWFNPLLWIACSILRRESEHACDDDVLGAGIEPGEYATHLLDIARQCRNRSIWSSAAAMSRPSTLERRIAAMLNPRLRRTALSRRALLTTAAALVAVTLPLAAVRAAQEAPQPLTGSIYDPTGAVVPDVKVTLEDAQQVATSTTTDASGRFEFPSVSPGTYVLQATLPGFKQLRQEVVLKTAADWDRAVTLQVGEVRETIAVREQRVPQPPSKAEGPSPIRVGGNIRAPRKIKDVRPVYPATMRDAGREGVVPLEAIIGRDGAVHSVRVLSAQIHPDFALAAADAVRQWRFEPTLLNGKPVEVVMNVSVEFSLSE